MNLMVLALIMGMAVPMVMSNQGEPVPVSSLCVMDANGVCWISEKEQIKRPIKDGDYSLSQSDFNRLVEKLKACHAQ